MDKQIIIEQDNTYNPIFTLWHSDGFEKTAAMSSDIIEFLEKAKPSKNKTYALINALTAGEYYSSNKNGDYFKEEDLKKSHTTFIDNGYVYFHHVNKDPEKSIGRVVFSHYNPTMRRVELIVEIDLNKEKAKEIINKIEGGQLVSTSMGCKVKYDQCSICGKQSKTRADYCEHLRYKMNKILPDGRKVYAINPSPRFFDISIVTIPADPTSSFIKVLKDKKHCVEETKKCTKKLASYEEFSYIKEAELENKAEITKVVKSETPAQVGKDPKQLANAVKLSQGKMKEDVIYKLSEYSLESVLSTMAALRILPSKEDFQKIAFLCFKQPEMAEYCSSNNIIFEIDENTQPIDLQNVGINNVQEKIASILEPHIPELSSLKHFAIARGLAKIAQITNDPMPKPILSSGTLTAAKTIEGLNSAERFVDKMSLYPKETTHVDQPGKWYPQQPPVERSLVSRLLFSSKDEPRISAVKNPIVPLGILGALYYGYVKVFNESGLDSFSQFMKKYPWLIPLLVGAGIYGSVSAQENYMQKTAGTISKFLRNSIVSLPVSFYMSGKYENDAREGKELTSIQNFVRKHPLLTALTTAGLGAKAETMLRDKAGLFKKGSLEEALEIKISNIIIKLPENEINNLYEDLLNI